MRALMHGIAGLLLGLTLLGGAVAVAAAQGGHPGSAAHAATRFQATAPQSQDCAQDQADTGTEPAAENTADTDNVQDATSPDTGTEAKGADTDNIDLQCGDQTGPDTGNAQTGRAQLAAVSQGRGLSLLAAQTGHANGAVQAQQTTKPATAATEQESATETEGQAGPDTDTLNVQCDQQGAQEGDNAGC